MSGIMNTTGARSGILGTTSMEAVSLTGTQSPTMVENELVLVKVALFTQSHSKSLRVFLCYTNDLV